MSNSQRLQKPHTSINEKQKEHPMKTHHVPIRTTLVLIGIALAAPLAMAGETYGTTSLNPKFQALDTDRDGYLSKSEMKGYRDYDRAFGEADADHDGKLSPDEFVKAESIYGRQQAAEYMDDSVITAKVKAALLKEMRSLDVSVETYRGHVLLSGFVDGQDQRNKAIQVAAAVNGVLKVEDGIALK